ncbi:hypothetical protein BV20DRAFT_1040100 [Pilatotrama ljubarskyi]|nr:hypothetical protein BV20DRAFT_1040100 [Pilatotrama ljubarskyi]
MLPDPLFDVVRAYATLRAPQSIGRVDIPFGIVHEFMLHRILLNPHFQKYPPSKQYQATFWKWAIEWLERLASDEARHILRISCDEIDECIYTHHIELIQELSPYVRSLGMSAPQASYLTYLWATQHPPVQPVYPGFASATLLESRTTIESGTTGLRTWSASLVLAQYLLNHPELVQNRRVLELGCGVGFLGIVAASVQMQDRTGSESVWLTDVNEPVLQRCEENLRLQCNPSHEHPGVHLRLLDWFDAADPERCSTVHALFAEARPDVLLGADVVYEPSIIPALTDTLVLALSQPDGGEKREAYIALTERNRDTLGTFVREAVVVASVLVSQSQHTTSAHRRSCGCEISHGRSCFGSRMHQLRRT